MMQELSRFKILSLGIVALNQKNGRRSMTISEYEKFNKYLHTKYDFVEGWYNVEAQEETSQYFDEITLKDKVVYRLRPDVDIDDLKRKINYYSVKLVKIVFSSEAVSNLDELTKEDEDNLEEFKRIDEKYQLEALYKLAQLEKQKRKLEARFSKIRNNALAYVDLDLAKTISSEEVRDLEDLQTSYYSHLER